MHATEEIDKVSIALNISNLGLALNTSGLTFDDCCYAFSLLAFVAGDWSCLCNTGDVLSSPLVVKSPLCISPTLGEAFSWMQKPVMINSLKEPTVPRGNHELAKAGMKASFLLLRLDMTFFNGDWIWTHPSQTSLDVTRAFIDSDMCRTILTSYEKQPVTASLNSLERSLACAVDCGAEWALHLYRKVVPQTKTFFGVQLRGFDAVPVGDLFQEPSRYKPGSVDEAAMKAASVLFGVESETRQEELRVPAPMADMEFLRRQPAVHLENR